MTSQLHYGGICLNERVPERNQTTYFLLHLIYYSNLLGIVLRGNWEYLHYCVIGLFAVHLIWKRSMTFVDYLVFGLISFFSFHGYSNDNFLPYWMMDNVFFLLSTVVLFNRRRGALEEFTSVVPNMVASWLMVGTILSWYIIIEIGLQPSEIGERIVRIDSEGTELASFDVLAPLYPALFIAPFYRHVSGSRKYVVILALITFFVFSFFTATRGGIVASVASLGLIMFSSNHSETGRFNNVLRVLLISFTGAALLINSYGSNNLQKAYDNVMFRFFESKDFSSGRATEERLLSESLTDKEWIIGRGFGGANDTWIWSHLENGINIVHKGYLFLVLKGGLLFLILIYGLALFSLYRLVRKGKAYYPFAFNIVLFLFMDQLHAQWLNLFACMFFWFAVSIGLNKESNIKA